MATPVSLRNVVDEMQAGASELHVFLNKVSGEFATLTQEHIDAIEGGDDISDYSDWEQEALQEVQQVLASDDFIKVPDQFDAHEYDIMQRFCLSIKDKRTSDDLLEAIQGSGAFRRFKSAIIRRGISQNWYDYKDQAYKEIAISWLESNGIAYADDMDSKHAK